MDALLRRRAMIAAGGTTPPTPLPYTPVEYIETDGTAYINTGVKPVNKGSAKMKILAKEGSSSQIFLGIYSGSEGASLFVMSALTASSKKCYFGYYYFYSSEGIPVSDSIVNGTPFDIQVSLVRYAQSLGVKQAGESSFTSYSKSQSSNTNSNYNLYLFAGCKPSNGTPTNNCVLGTRVYECKIYSEGDYQTLVFDGVPCYYNGEYGIWDKVSDTFFGNAAESGAFTGPQI